jgi:hypothetical protein
MTNHFPEERSELLDANVLDHDRRRRRVIDPAAVSHLGTNSFQRVKKPPNRKIGPASSLRLLLEVGTKDNPH